MALPHVDVDSAMLKLSNRSRCDIPYKASGNSPEIDLATHLSVKKPNSAKNRSAWI